MFIVYKTTNKINGKIYVGKHQTNDLNDGYFGSGKLLEQAIKKYGSSNFIREVMFVFDNESDMNAKEKEIVTEAFCARQDTYNLLQGGHGGFSYLHASGLSRKGSIKAGKMVGSITGPDNVRLQRGIFNTKYKEDIKKWSLMGAGLGGKIANGKGRRGKKFRWMTNGYETRCIELESCETWLAQGFCYGRKLYK